MSVTQRVAAYMQEYLTPAQQLAMLNLMSAAKDGREFSISNELAPHAVNICGILMMEVACGHQSEVAA